MQIVNRLESRVGANMAQLAHGLLAFGSAELLGRVARLATTVVIARQLTPGIVGEAALALTLFELIRVLERVGTGQQIVLATPSELPAVCNTVNRIYWVWTMSLMVLQLLVAAVLGLVFHREIAGWMLAGLSLVFVFMASGHVNYFLAMRAGMMGKLARLGAVQTVVDQFLTLVLMMLWPSPWAIVIPKIVAAPVWLVCVLKAHPWQPVRDAGILPLGQILRSSGSILLADSLSALRTQGDNLIIAAMLGTTALGNYYFAFNAGLGIVTSIATALASVIFPILSRAAEGAARRKALGQVMLVGLGLLVPMVLLQAAAARFYVPIVFGPRWEAVSPLVSILCLAGVPLLVNQIVTAWLRANRKMEQDAGNALFNCLASLAGLALGGAYGSVLAAACGLVAGSTMATAWIAIRHLVARSDK